MLLPSVSRVCRAVLLAYFQVREARTLLFGAMMVVLMMFCDFRAYMWLRVYGMICVVVWA